MVITIATKVEAWTPRVEERINNLEMQIDKNGESSETGFNELKGMIIAGARAPPTMKERQKMAQEVGHSARTVTEVMNVLINNNLFN